MNDREKFQRMLLMVERESKNPLGLWYLSYADEDHFRGAVYIEAHGPASAAMRANAVNLSPGGEVFILGPIPEDKWPDRKFWNRMLDKEDVRAANPDDRCGTLAEFKEEFGINEWEKKEPKE